MRNLVWGLVPSWAKDPKIGSRLINARAETVADKPAFRAAFARRRLIVPISGFYEWFPTQQLGRAGKPIKQPFYLHPAGHGPAAAVGRLVRVLAGSEQDLRRSGGVVVDLHHHHHDRHR